MRSGKAAWLLLIWLAAAPAALADVIHLKDGTELSGTIPSGGISRTQVRIQRGGQTQSVPVNQILWIRLEDKEPITLHTIRRQVLEGNYDGALKNIRQVEELDPEKVKDPDAKQEVLFYRARALAGSALESGDVEKVRQAGKALVQFVKQYPQSWHYYEANELIGRLLLAVNKPQDAATYFARLEEAPWPDVQLQGRILAAEALLKQGKAEEALGRFEQVLQQARGNPQLQQVQRGATVGKATALAALGRFQQAIPLLESVINEIPPEDHALRATLYNALGTSQEKAGNKREALLAFLHVDLLYFRADPDQHAQALYHLSRLWDELGHPDRARDARTRLLTRYRTSRWAGMLGASGGQ